jgi:hypothetical protein
MTSSCSAKLSIHQRRMLQSLLEKESQIVQQCNQHNTQFTEILNELQCINHHHDLDERAIKCDEFVRLHAQIKYDQPLHEMVPGAIQIALSCDCMCIQAACFRILHKWIPMLDTWRMKLLKIKNICADDATKHVPKNGVTACTKIEQILRKMLKPTPNEF